MVEPADIGAAPLSWVAAELLAEREELADHLVALMRDRVTEFADFDEPELWEAVRASTLANLIAGLEAMGGDRRVPAEIPADARELALLTARLGLPLAGVLHLYRVGHAAVWQRLFQLLESEPIDPPLRREALQAASTYLFEHVDRVSTMVTDEYTAERDRLLRSREQRRTQLVRDVLEGESPDPDEALRDLGYDLRLQHLALVVTAADPERVVRAAGRALDAPHRLTVSLARDTAWAWLGRSRPFELPERMPEIEGAQLSFGDPAAGSDGFRSSHRQARDAHRVGQRGGARGGSVRYDEVALESLAAADPERARAFVARELRGLAGEDTRSRRLRETLRAYFAVGQNATSAAAMLGVHEHTVSYRLRTIEELLGRPVTQRRAELEMALRLLELE